MPPLLKFNYLYLRCQSSRQTFSGACDIFAYSPYKQLWTPANVLWAITSLRVLNAFCVQSHLYSHHIEMGQQRCMLMLDVSKAGVHFLPWRKQFCCHRTWVGWKSHQLDRTDDQCKLSYCLLFSHHHQATQKKAKRGHVCNYSILDVRGWISCVKRNKACIIWKTGMEDLTNVTAKINI